MKKSLILLGATFAIAVASCSKKSSVAPTSNAPTKINKVAYAVSHGYNAEVGGCLGDGSDCTGLIATLPNIAAMNTAIASGPTGVGGFFNNEGLSGGLYESITETELTDLRSGSYTLLPVPGAPVLTYFIGNASTLSLTNYEFVLVGN